MVWVDGTLEPSARRSVVHHAEHTVADGHFLDVPKRRPTIRFANVEPSVKPLRDPMLQGHVDAMRGIPAVAGHDRPTEAFEKLAVLACARQDGVFGAASRGSPTITACDRSASWVVYRVCN